MLEEHSRNKQIIQASVHANEESIKIWRYMDITQLISLLDKKALFFARSDKSPDYFEGLHTKASIKSLDSSLEKVNEKDPAKYLVSQITGIMKSIPEKSKPYFYINCWHGSEYESMAMWSIYAKDNKGISIQSNLKKLKECLSKSHCYYNKEYVNAPSIYTEKIKYVNTETFCEDFSSKNWNRNCFFKKLESYDYEREIRALIDLTSESENINEFNYLNVIENDGIYIYVDLDFIEKIFVCPLAPNWVLDVVKSIAEKYEIGEEKITRSSLVADSTLK